MPATIAARTMAWQLGQRGLPSANNARTPATITFPTTGLISRARIALTPDYTVPYWQWGWADITDYVRWDQGISIEFGRADQADTVDASICRLKIDNRDGRFARQLATGPYYPYLTRQTPIWIEADPGDGYHDRYMGFVVSWPKRWDRSATDATVSITCKGMLNQLLHRKTKKSALYYAMAGVAPGDYKPYVYWPMEDGSTATGFASGLAGGTSAAISGTVEPAIASTPAGSNPLPLFGLGATVQMPVASYTATGKWAFQWVVNIPSSPVVTPYVIADIPSPGGGVARWQVSLQDASPSPDLLFLKGYNSAGTEVLSDSSSVGTEFYGSTWMMTVSTFQNGVPTVAGALDAIREDQEALATAFDTAPGSHSGVSGTVVLTSPIDDTVMGHGALYTDSNFSVSLFGQNDADVNAQALPGFDDEQAHERIIRLCRTDSIPLLCTVTSSAEVGPQRDGSILEVLRETEKADLGLLSDAQFGLRYNTISDRYGQPSSMVLNIAQGDLTDDLQPDDDDSTFHNQWKAKRTNGSFHIAQPDGGLDPGGALYDDEDTFNVRTDEQTVDVSNWLLHRDNNDKDRWPNVTISLAKKPALIPAWLALQIGSRITVNNVMDTAGVDTLDLIVEGWREGWNSKQWEVTLNCSDASVYDVLELDDGPMDTTSATLAASIGSGDTSLSVAVSASDLWTTDAADVPFGVEVDGEQMTVTAIAGGSSPQTFTVTRSVNGVVKAHSAGDAVVVYPAPIMAL